MDVCDNWIISNFGTFLHVIVHLSEKLFTIILTFARGDSNIAVVIIVVAVN